MTYKIERLENVLNKEGKEETFVSVIYTDEELGAFPFAKWLTAEEYALYKADETNINTIVENNFEIARVRKVEELEYIASHPEGEQ